MSYGFSAKARKGQVITLGCLSLRCLNRMCCIASVSHCMCLASHLCCSVLHHVCVASHMCCNTNVLQRVALPVCIFELGLASHVCCITCVLHRMCVAVCSIACVCLCMCVASHVCCIARVHL